MQLNLHLVFCILNIYLNYKCYNRVLMFIISLQHVLLFAYVCVFLYYLFALVLILFLLFNAICC